MIYVDRKRVDPPSILFSDRAIKEKERLHSFYSQRSKKKQTRYNGNMRLLNHVELRERINLLFHAKCAYCESLYINNHVDHFRPKRNAMNLDGSVSENHYWWLTYEWENLYSSCRNCNFNKRSRFPVQGRRSSKDQPVSKEQPWILDPCNPEDFREQHFYYSEDGKMIGITRRGEITIDIFKLNRVNLIETRKKIIDRSSRLISLAALTIKRRGKAYNEIEAGLKDLISPSSEHTSVAIHYVKAFSERLSNIENPKLFNTLLSDVLGGSLETRFDKQIELSQEMIQDKMNKKDYSYSMKMDSEEAKMAYFSSAKKIKKIEISNFKNIKLLTLDFPKSTTSEEPWMVLLGENGTGKSSVLQAVALTLAGEERANALGLDASKFINQNTRAKTGYVKVFLEGLDEPCELHFSKESRRFTCNFMESKVILLAFGSTRLMADVSEGTDSINNVRNLRNLFDPFATLPDVEEWISNPNTVSVLQFDQIAIELKKLLQLPEDKLIYRRKTKEGRYELFIKVSKERHGIRVRELSAGYQAIIVMTLTIIRELLSTWDTFSIAEGIVLIDEIGVHLHPKWKLQIIGTLRAIFPAMNFLITTHEPLCLRGINEGEVALMKLDESNQVIALVDLPSPKALTIEQLITSKFFGLITSFDPEVETQLNTFYLLNSKLEPSEQEREQLEIVRQELEELNIIDSDAKLGVSKPIETDLRSSVLDTGWVANPQHQDDLKKRIQEIWSKKGM
ncbi:AAA family ATPase [uncultured Dokdonia sp.]|uniref:AAA family ATPase n=1 Tax=uncultured Dokdonia sp. TaxID=575653 RepID=UPI002626732C|nr:AAA family ATPase [uncultured Dokdonia sp.]